MRTLSYDEIHRELQARAKDRPLSAAFFDLLSTTEVHLSLDTLHRIGKDLGKEHQQWICPQVVSSFLAGLFRGRNVKNVVDPWPGLGTLVIPIAEALLHYDKALAISAYPHSVAACTSIASTATVECVEAQPVEWLRTTNVYFDLIISSLPFGARTAALAFTHEGRELDLGRNLEDQLLVLSCLRLAEDGIAAFVVPPSFTWRRDAASPITILRELGLCLDAYVQLPAGTFAPTTMMPSAIVLIRRGPSHSVFVGELSGDARHNKNLLANLAGRRPGSTFAAGRLVSPEELDDYESLRAQETVAALAKGCPYPSVKLGEIAVEIIQLRRGCGGAFVDKANAMYIHTSSGSVVTSIDELPRSRAAQMHYFQVVLDERRAMADYVARFLNTPLGRAVRLVVSRGGGHTQTGDLREMQLFLPSIERQSEVLDTNTRVTNLVSELRELESRLWNTPHRSATILTALDKVNREDRFTDWLDSLPFPLASILWAYHAAGGDDKRRYEHLLHFFEALAQFLATILLSAFQNDEEAFSAERNVLRELLAREHLSLTRSTFGAWVKLVERLSKSVKRLSRGSDEDQMRCNVMFRISDMNAYQFLFAVQLIHVLAEANSLRNQWKGHGGIVGDREAKLRHSRLSGLLAEVRSAYGDSWKSYQLILPRSARYTVGLYQFDVERLMGTRTPFELIQLSTKEPMEDGYLHLMSPNSDKALKLLPFVRVLRSPAYESNACYFYNRIEREGIRFVSYHFEAEAEIVDAFGDTAGVLKLLETTV